MDVFGNTPEEEIKTIVSELTSSIDKLTLDLVKYESFIEELKKTFDKNNAFFLTKIDETERNLKNCNDRLNDFNNRLKTIENKRNNVVKNQ